MRRAAGLACVLALLISAPARADVGDYLGKPLASVRLAIEGRDVNDPKLLQIVETQPGAPLSMVEVRETVTRLFSLGRFEDIRVRADATPAGVSLLYDLVPLHPVDKIVFSGTRGVPGIDNGRLRQEVVDRYGASPPVGRASDLARIVGDDLHARGYLHAVVTPRADLQHAPDRATLVFVVQPGMRTTIGEIQIAGDPGMSRPDLLKRLQIASGSPYESDALAAANAHYIEDRRSHGYFEAKLVPTTHFSDDDRTVDLTLTAAQGPHVRVVFAGDPLPSNRRDELVPIEREGSVNEDLLEDSSNGIEEYLHAEGYRDASAPHTRQQSDNDLLITFTVKRGPQYRIARVEISGNTTVPLADFAAGLRVREGQPFSSAKLVADVSAIEDFYRRQGFASVNIDAKLDPVPDASTATEIPVIVRVAITENARTIVGGVRIEGNPSVGEAGLLKELGLQPGRPFFATQIALDRDTIQVLYANLGFQNATVDANPGLSADNTRADVAFTVHEGPRLLIDHVLIVGNVRTKTETIERELQFKPGDPLGVAAVNDTQRRLTQLGLFRRVEITQVGHGEQDRDVLISVDEAPVTTIGYGGGVEAGERIRSTEASGGAAQQHLEFAPRAFFTIGRSNLFGKNRSINLFTRISLWPKDSPFFTTTQPQAASSGGQFGFSEYRVLTTFREPHVFGTPADAVLTGVMEQQIRPSFDFARRGVTAEVGRRLTRKVSVSGNYQIQRVKLFNEQILPSDQLLVDRLFPQVLLSSFSSSVIRNTRNDPIDPTTGTYFSANGQIAARAIGSEVGLVKSFVTEQLFHTLPHARGTVLATRVELGVATGFPRNVNGEVVKDLPASERFFAGGDTTVRGFALDQLGAPATIDPVNGFPNGGNALVIFNAELRVPYRKFQVVGFFDTGNVFAQPDDIDLGQLRSAVGFGLRYKSPVGPIRVDLGFKIHRQEIVPGVPGLEPLTALHLSLGQAF